MHNATQYRCETISPVDYSFRRQESRDARQHELALEGSRHAYNLVDRTPFNARMTELRLGPARIVRDELEHSIDYVGESYPGNLVFFVFIPRSSSAFWDGRPVDARTLIKYPGDQPHRAFCSGPSECIGILFDEDDMMTFARARDSALVDPRMMRGNCFLADPALVRRFLRLANRLLANAGSEQACFLDDADWRARALDAVRGMLLDILEAGIADPGKLPPPPTRAYIVEKAIDFMNSSLGDPPAMQRICDALRVSSRTLRYSFEEILGVSPTQYLLSLRLCAVREKLLEGVPTSTINRIAQDHGFGHMGRFAQFYREVFGELPSQTCRLSATAATRRGVISRRPSACRRSIPVHAVAAAPEMQRLSA